MLLRLGIVARIQTVVSGYKNPVHMVWVSGAESQLRFLAKVGAFGPREVPAANLARALDRKVANTNVDTVPVEVFDRVRGLMRDENISNKSMSVMAGVSYSVTTHSQYAPSRSSLKRYAEILKDTSLNDLCENDIFWDRIVSIMPAGIEEVYDLTVLKTESWISDGIILHNSGAIEQDADMVCFIYRDEVYNKETEDRGIAELIVAKHRAGETDTICLAWLAEYTLFANLAKDSPGSPISPIRPDKGDGISL